jgi:hypothetical protein
MLLLTAIGLVALRLAIAFPTERGDAVPWRDRDYILYYQAHQLFRCDPEELSESQLHDLDRWCRCVRITGRLEASGVQTLTDEECQFVLQVLDELCPDTELFAGFAPIYESCARSLAQRRSAVASNREWHSRDRPVMLE